MAYFANAGPRRGPLLWRDRYDAIDVLADPNVRTPIGMAWPVGWTDGGIATWDITVRGRLIPGRWIVLGREFLPAK